MQQNMIVKDTDLDEIHGLICNDEHDTAAELLALMIQEAPIVDAPRPGPSPVPILAELAGRAANVEEAWDHGNLGKAVQEMAATRTEAERVLTAIGEASVKEHPKLTPTQKAAPALLAVAKAAKALMLDIES